MAIISNINGKLTVSDQGQVSFNRIGTSTTTGYTFPALDGTANQILKTNSNGVLTFVDDENDDTLYALAGAASGTNYNLVLSADGSAQNTMVFKPGTNVTFTKAANSLTINSSDQYEGTVKSVGYTHQGNAFTVGGQPITSTGIIAVTMAGTSSQYIDGAGNLTNISTLPDSVNDIAVTVASYGGGNRYFLDGERQIPAILKPGFTYRFDQSSSANVGNSGHPLRFSTNDNNSPAAPYTTGVTAVGTPGSAGAYTQIITSQATPYLYYYCTIHSGMGGPVPRQVNQISTGQGITAVPIDGNVQISNALATTVNNGGIRIGYSSIGSTDYPVLLSSNKAYVNISGSSNLSRWTATGTSIYNNNSGSVGIGITSAARQKLEVAGRIYIEQQGTDWNETTPGTAVGAIHLDPVGDGANNTGNAITFGASDSGGGNLSQAGVYVRSDGAYGTKMYLATTDSYAAGSKTRMMINESGNVGIGTTLPIKKLDISEVYTQGSSAVERLQLVMRGSTGSLDPIGDTCGLGFAYSGSTASSPYIKTGIINEFTNSNGTSSLHLCTSAVAAAHTITKADARLTILAGGKVQVGPTPGITPAILSSRRNGTCIEFGHGNNTGRYEGTLGAFGSNGSSYIGFSTECETGLNTFTTRGGKGNIINGAENGDLIFSQVTTLTGTGLTPVERMRISSNGNVTIGNTASVQPLTVAGNVLFRTTTVDGFENRFQFLPGGAGDGGSFLVYNENEAPTIQIKGNGISYFVGGNVGIGVTSPNYTLDVNGTAGFGSTTAQIWYANGNGDTYTLSALYMNQSNASNNDANGYFWERGRITNSSTAEIRRWVVGARGGQKQMMLDGPGNLTVAGDVVAFGSPSDKRLKENIKPIESALDKVSKLQGVTFDWIQKEDKILDIKQDIGFIAQDVQKVIPELVRENEDGMLSMRHQGIAPILLEAIKELKQEIEELKNKPCNCNCK